MELKDEGAAIIARNISKTFCITEDSYNTIKNRFPNGANGNLI